MMEMDTEHNRIIQKYYEERASDYDEQKSRTWNSKEGFSSKIIMSILDSLSNLRKGLILEVGVGSGRIAFPFLNSNSTRFIGLDLSWEMLKLANKRLSAFPVDYNFLLGNGESLPIKRSILDGLLCISMFHYFTSPEEILMKFAKSLKEGGVYVYGDLTLHEQDTNAFLDRLEKTISHAHVKYFTPSKMKSLIERSGIKIDGIDTLSYQKSYKALLQDKAHYFGVHPTGLHELVANATEEEKALYELEEEEMTLYYTIMKGILR